MFVLVPLPPLDPPELPVDPEEPDELPDEPEEPEEPDELDEPEPDVCFRLLTLWPGVGVDFGAGVGFGLATGVVLAGVFVVGWDVFVAGLGVGFLGCVFGVAVEDCSVGFIVIGWVGWEGFP